MLAMYELPHHHCWHQQWHMESLSDRTSRPCSKHPPWFSPNGSNTNLHLPFSSFSLLASFQTFALAHCGYLHFSLALIAIHQTATLLFLDILYVIKVIGVNETRQHNGSNMHGDGYCGSFSSSNGYLKEWWWLGKWLLALWEMSLPKMLHWCHRMEKQWWWKGGGIKTKYH